MAITPNYLRGIKRFETMTTEQLQRELDRKLLYKPNPFPFTIAALRAEIRRRNQEN